MKKYFKIGVPDQVIVIGLVCGLFYNCSSFNKIYSENDIVYSTKRFELKYDYKDRDRRTPIYFFTQSIVKEIDQNNE